MSLSNYPPGVTGNENHLTGVVRCTDCGRDITRAWENDECEDVEWPTCPDCCREPSEWL